MSANAEPSQIPTAETKLRAALVVLRVLQQELEEIRNEFDTAEEREWGAVTRAAIREVFGAALTLEAGLKWDTETGEER